MKLSLGLTPMPETFTATWKPAPWSARTAELESQSPSAWNDYAAWQEWTERELVNASDDGYADWQLIADTSSLPALYLICCRLCELGRESPAGDQQ